MSAPFPIVVTDHAYWRAAERFRSFRTETIEDEILAAFQNHRVSPKCPTGISNGTFPDSLYAWTPDEKRVYVLRARDRNDAFAVVTVMDIRNG